MMRTMQRKRTQPRRAPFRVPTLIAVLCLASVSVGLFATSAMATGSKSDINRDGLVDLEDLKLFSDKTLGQDWQTVDWCAWITLLKEEGKIQRKHDELVDFIWTYFQCDAPPAPDPLEVKNELLYPTRMAWGPNGRLFVSDAKVESVFIYEVIPADIGPSTLNLTGELKHVGKVVGMAVTSNGLIYVGDGQRKRVEKYNQKGEMVGTLGYGILRAPSDLTFDSSGNLYVADAESDVVWVFAPNGSLLRTIRRGGLKRPTAVEVTYVDDGTGTGNLVGELFVASKGDYLVKVFDLDGNFLRSFGGFPDKEGWFNPVWLWEGKFIGLQSLAVDGNGNVHALDIYMAKGQILDPITGAFITSYGELGTDPGQLSLPMDVIISNAGEVIVANADLHRVEVIYTIP